MIAPSLDEETLRAMRHYTQQERATFRLATVVAIAALLGVLVWRVLHFH